ncbi:MAG: CDP-alcohol phosphatidyltransferase family protein [Planctomycetes bacterium]|nr:CDP-alcohol phosphatidyltransferase family protein [Planctomycetota bacterium]
MSITAIIVLSESSGNSTTARWCTREIASIPLYKHCILSARKAGVTKFVFLGCGLREEIENDIKVKRQIETDIVWYDNEATIPLVRIIADEIRKDEKFFIIRANYFFDYRVLESLTRHTFSDKFSTVVCVNRSETVENSTGNSTAEDTDAQTKIQGGIVVASPYILTILDPHLPDLSFEGLLEILQRENLLKYVAVEEYVHGNIDSEEILVSFEEKLYQSLGSSSDSPILDKYVIRRISGFISRLSLRTPVTPNQVTIASLVLGLMSGVYFSFGGFTYGVFGGLLYFLSVILDQCDGEVARLKYMESESGRILDIITDTVVNAAIVVGITLGIYRNDKTGFIIILGLLAMLGISVSLLLTTFSENKGGQSCGADDFFDKLNNKDLFYIIIIFCIFINQMIWFLWVMAIGTNLYWVALKVVHPIRRLVSLSVRGGKV